MLLDNSDTVAHVEQRLMANSLLSDIYPVYNYDSFSSDTPSEPPPQAQLALHQSVLELLARGVEEYSQRCLPVR